MKRLEAMRAFGCWMLAVALFLSGGAATSWAADPAQETGLKLAPADAAFFSSMLRNREQIEAIAKSKAWAKLQSLPFYQGLWKKLQDEWNSPTSDLAHFRKHLEAPENRQLVELLIDMGSHEVFCFGGERCAGLVQLLAEASGSMRFGPAMMQLSGQAAGKDPNQLQAMMFLQALAENADQLAAPDLVLGFKTTTPDAARAQLARLEKHLMALAQQVPQLQGKVKRAAIGGGDYLTLSLDGSMVPWDEIPWKEFEEQAGQFDKLRKKLRELKLAISVGLRESYLILAVGESTDLLAKLGQGPALPTRPEFKPLAKYADQRLTSISYISKAFIAKLNTNQSDLDDLFTMMKEALPIGELSKEKQERLQKDLEELKKDLQNLVPEPGAMFGVTFWSTRGHESVTYDWSQQLGVDGSKPLTLLNHVGGSPILAAVGRSKYSPEGYQLFVKWVKRINGYVEEMVVPQLDDEQKQQYQLFVKIAHPMFRRLDEVTGKKFLPALADGQTAFVLDAKVSSKQWVMLLPPATTALPLPELAFVLGVSDASLLQQAMGDYRGILNDTIAKAREFLPFIPELQIPPPEVQKAAGGQIFYYSLPPGLLDPQLLPNAGLGEKVAVLSLSRDQSRRILASTPLQAGAGPLADLNKARASAVYFNWPALLKMAEPWIEYGLQQAGGEIEGPAELGLATNADLLKQIHTLFEILSCLKSYSGSTMLEDGAFVTYGLTVISDL